jgi:predicted lipoprotein with Yx(FWY)xxD motif
MKTKKPSSRSTRSALRLSGAIAVAASAALLLAACGSSGGKVSSQPPAASSSAPTTTAPSSQTETSKAIAMTASSSLGTILVDSKGMTLYTLTNNGKPVACTGQCLMVWPPLLLASGTTTPVGAAGVSNLGTAMQSGGTQVTYSGDPLYRFSNDKAPGDTNGEGISAFGGVWHVVKVSGSTATTAAPAAAVPATTPTTSSSGYGY